MNQKDGDNDDSFWSPRGVQRNYELLGAPVLLFRNEAWYSSLQLPPDPVTDPQFEHLTRRKRAHARWYYPMDFHRLNQVTGEIPDLHKATRNSIDDAQEDSGEDSQEESENDSQMDPEKSSQAESEDKRLLDYGQARRQLLRAVANRLEREQERTIRDPGFREEQNMDQQQGVRSVLLRDHDKKRAQRVIPWYQQHDVNAFPARLNVVREERDESRRAAFRFTERQNRRLLLYANERMNRAEPAYLAPWQQSSWMDSYEGIEQVGDGSSSANRFGNCLVSFQCRCKTCNDSVSPNWWILHPIGPLLETIRLSHFATPGGREVWRGSKFASARGMKITALNCSLDTEDNVLEIKQCGDHLFIARGSSYCTLFRVADADVTNTGPNNHLCLGGSQFLLQVKRLDLRCFLRGSLSYRPWCVTSHPRFGGDFLDAKVAVVLELEDRKVCNSIREYMVGDEIRPTEHTIHNLQVISDVQYSSSHPMVLWASARSYIKPLPFQEKDHVSPKVGFGLSLFSIDLRNDKAMFQWSPSAAEFSTEGINSISSVMTDWNRENTAFVSSISAKMTWELDMRMPCRPVSCWSLPHYSEGPGTERDEFGVFGAGMIFSRPTRVYGHGMPLFAVNKTPGTTGIHLYQSPNSAPSFQCSPAESVFTPAVNCSSVSVATSILLPLPDAAGSVFTCGLTSFRVPTHDLLPSTDSVKEQTILDYARTTVCVVSSTNKGDLYLHPLLESKSGASLASVSGSGPLGNACVGVPREKIALDRTAPHNWLPVNLSNECPVSSSAIIIPLEEEKRTAKKIKISWKAEFENMEDAVEVKARLPMSCSGQSVKLDSGFVKEQEDSFSMTMNCFDNRLRRAQLREIRREKNSERTDLTEEMIEDAELDWRYGHDSDQSEDSDSV